MLHVPCSNSSCRICTGGCEIFVPSRIALERKKTASMAMVWAVYTGASLCVRERFHIRIMVAVKSLPERIGRPIIILADCMWALFCVFMIRVSIDYLSIFWRFPETSPSLGINQF